MEDDRGARGQLPEDNPTDPLTGCIYYSDVVWPARYQLSTSSWFVSQFTEEGPTPLQRCEDSRVLIQTDIRRALL
jgi:hypothetical protein